MRTLRKIMSLKKTLSLHSCKICSLGKEEISQNIKRQKHLQLQRDSNNYRYTKLTCISAKAYPRLSNMK